MPDVTMPRLSDSMEEGTILKWLKSDGDEVAKGEELVEIETDKATMTYEADGHGTLSIVAQEGETLPIGEVIARLGEGRGDGAQAAEAGEAQEEEAPQEEPVAEDEPAAEATAEGDGSAPQAAPERAERRPAEPAPQAGGNGGRPKASPVARRIARERGIDLTALEGSGPGGRIVKADVEAAAERGGVQAPAEEAEVEAPAREEEEAAAAAAAPAAEAAPEPEREKPPATARGEVEVVEPNRVQQVIARRMAESKATIPEFTLSADVDMERCVKLREELKGVAQELDMRVPSFNDMVVKACAIALREFPRANAAYKDGRFELYSRVNVGVAVAGQDSLVVPTIFDADQKGLARIATETRALAGKVREGKITPPELGGGTFTVSNLGMFGISSFTAVINPPQAAILAVGALEPRPVVRKGKLKVRTTMSVTLACDHRILYGAPAAEFLGRITAILERPVALAL
jgi:pyruvate dehydrogenase E2 component (dihydrolipoamide acetyltransferase)